MTQYHTLGLSLSTPGLVTAFNQSTILRRPTYPHSEDDSADKEHLLVVGSPHGDGPPGEHNGRDDDGGLPAEPDTNACPKIPSNVCILLVCDKTSNKREDECCPHSGCGDS